MDEKSLIASVGTAIAMLFRVSLPRKCRQYDTRGNNMINLNDLNNALSELQGYRNAPTAVLYRTAQRVMNEARTHINSAKAAEKAMEKKAEAIAIIKAADKAENKTDTTA